MRCRNTDRNSLLQSTELYCKRINFLHPPQSATLVYNQAQPKPAAQPSTAWCSSPAGADRKAVTRRDHLTPGVYGGTRLSCCLCTRTSCTAFHVQGCLYDLQLPALPHVMPKGHAELYMKASWNIHGNDAHDYAHSCNIMCMYPNVDSERRTKLTCFHMQYMRTCM